MATENPALIVAGTFVSDPVSRLVYRQLAKVTDAEIMTLHQAGLGETRLSVEKVIDEAERRSDMPVLIGHSQGGLVAALAASLRPDLFGGTITLGAPLAGTHLASPWLLAPGLASMSPRSAVIRDVGYNPNRDPRMVNIVGEKDALILPHWSGLIRGAEHYSFPVGHMGLVLDSEVVDFVAFLVRSTPWASFGQHPIAV